MRRLPFACLLLFACGSRTELDETAAGPVRTDAGVPIGVVSNACSDGLRDWILFEYFTSDYTLYAMRGDGTGLHKVTLPHGPAFRPSVSPDGKKLLYGGLFSSPNAPGVAAESALYSYDLTSHTSTLVRIVPGLSYSALSPDETTVAYVDSYTLRACNADGTNDHALLVGPDSNGTGYGHPTFAADSLTVVYGNGGTLGRIRVDGTQQEDLLTETATFSYPNGGFSPDRQTLAAGVDCGVGSLPALALFPYGALPAACTSGNVLTPVSSSSSPNAANDPSWGANGTIAYASGVDVFIIPQAGGTPVNFTAKLTTNGRTASDPVWFPACATLP